MLVCTVKKRTERMSYVALYSLTKVSTQVRSTSLHQIRSAEQYEGEYFVDIFAGGFDSREFAEHITFSKKRGRKRREKVLKNANNTCQTKAQRTTQR